MKAQEYVSFIADLQEDAVLLCHESLRIKSFCLYHNSSHTQFKKKITSKYFILNNTESYVDLSSIFSWNNLLPNWNFVMRRYIFTCWPYRFGKNAHFLLNKISCCCNRTMWNILFQKYRIFSYIKKEMWQALCCYFGLHSSTLSSFFC